MRPSRCGAGRPPYRRFVLSVLLSQSSPCSRAAARHGPIARCCTLCCTGDEAPGQCCTAWERPAWLCPSRGSQAGGCLHPAATPHLKQALALDGCRAKGRRRGQGHLARQWRRHAAQRGQAVPWWCAVLPVLPPPAVRARAVCGPAPGPASNLQPPFHTPSCPPDVLKMDQSRFLMAVRPSPSATCASLSAPGRSCDRGRGRRGRRGGWVHGAAVAAAALVPGPVWGSHCGRASASGTPRPLRHAIPAKPAQRAGSPSWPARMPQAAAQQARSR